MNRWRGAGTLVALVAAFVPMVAPVAHAQPVEEPQPPPNWRLVELNRNGQREVWIEDGSRAFLLERRAETFPVERWDIETIADLNGDGRDDVIVSYYTGGAHCCFEYSVFASDAGEIRRQDRFSLGNSSMGALFDVDGDGIPEILTADDRLAYFPDLSFADSPFLALVLCRTMGGAFDGLYADCTTRFPDRLVESAGLYEALLGTAVDEQEADPRERTWAEARRRGAALGIAANYARLQRLSEGWAIIRKLCPECEGWIATHRDELEKRLAILQPEHL